MPDLQTEVPDPKTEVPDLGSGGIRLNLTPGPIYIGCYSLTADPERMGG